MKLPTATPTIRPEIVAPPCQGENAAAASASCSTVLVSSVSITWHQPLSPDAKMVASSDGKKWSAGNLVDGLTPLGLNGFTVFPLPFLSKNGTANHLNLIVFTGVVVSLQHSRKTHLLGLPPLSVEMN